MSRLIPICKDWHAVGVRQVAYGSANRWLVGRTLVERKVKVRGVDKRSPAVFEQN